MTDHELTEIKSDLKEIKEMMKIVSRTVAADKELAAQRSLRKLEDDRIARQIRKMPELAD